MRRGVQRVAGGREREGGRRKKAGGRGRGRGRGRRRVEAGHEHLERLGYNRIFWTECLLQAKNS